MNRKLALAFAASLLVSNARAPELDTPQVLVRVPGVSKVTCFEGSGTAFRVGGPGAYTSVDHVTSLHNCMVDGEPLRTVYADKKLDFSSSRVTKQASWLRINCEGFKAGQDYMAVGYARGSFGKQRAVFLTPAEPGLAALVPWDDYTVLVGEGRLIPGQSGGPIFNRAGEVVGIAKGYFTGPVMASYALPLSDTPLCTGHI